MRIDVAKELAVLEAMTLPELRVRYAGVLGEASRSRNRQALVRRILWRLQARAEGDLSQRARRRAAELAEDAALRLDPPKGTPQPVATGRRDPRLPAPGTVLTRLYKGRLLEVTVLADGFAYAGARFRSLSALAKHVTGSHSNGFLFFGLVGKEGKRA